MAIYRYTLLGKFVGQDCQNTFHIRSDDPLTLGDRGDLADDIRDALNSVVSADSRWSDQYTLSQISSQRVDLPAQILLNHTVANVVGFSGGATLSPATTISAQWRTFTDRPNRGRSSIGGWSVLASDTNGTPVANAMTQANAWASAILNAINTYNSGAVEAVVARYTGSPLVASIANAIVDWIVQDKFGTQRSRITGRGS